MEIDQDDLSLFICKCGSANCRGTYMKKKNQSHNKKAVSVLATVPYPTPSPTPISITTTVQAAISVNKSENSKIRYMVKVTKFVQYMLTLTKSRQFISALYTSKQSQVSRRILMTHSIKKIKWSYLYTYMDTNQDMINSILKSHKKQFTYSQAGFSVFPLNE